MEPHMDLGSQEQQPSPSQLQQQQLQQQQTMIPHTLPQQMQPLPMEVDEISRSQQSFHQQPPPLIQQQPLQPVQPLLDSQQQQQPQLQQQQQLPQQQPQDESQQVPPPPTLKLEPTDNKEPIVKQEPNSEHIKQRLQDLVNEVDPDELLDEDVEQILLELADEFIEDVVSSSCAIAKHRNSKQLDVEDVKLCLERKYRMWVPGFGVNKQPVKSFQNEAHKQRMALISRTNTNDEK